MARLTNSIAIVTGGARGIGAAITRALVAEGARVAIGYLEDEAAARALAVDLGGDAVVIARRADVRVAAEMEAIFDAAQAQFGGVNLLVNNAGVYSFGPVKRFDEAEYRRIFDTNVLGVLNGCRLAAQRFGEAGGAIINIGSAAAALNEPYSALYSASKAAVNSLTKVLASELGPRRIRVNAICPGVIDTESGRAASSTVGDYVERTIASTPLGRMGEVGDIAKVAVFLASDEAGWVTGETMLVAGGKR